MDYLQLAIIIYIAGMMFTDLFLLYLLYRSSNASRRAVLFTSSIFFYMSAEAIDIGYILFQHGSVLVEPISLMLASIPIFLSLAVKDKGFWKEDWVSSTFLALTLVIDELAMGYSYSAAFGPHMNPLVSAVSNPAFGIMMLIDASFFLTMSRHNINVKEVSLFTFAVSMAFMPNIFRTFESSIQLVGAVLSSIIMIVNIVTLYLLQMRRISLNAQVLSLSLAGFDFIMMLGLSIFASSSDLTFLSLSMIASMVWYFVLIFYRFSDKKITYGLKIPILFVFLINMAELTMGFGDSVMGFNITNDIFSAHMMNHGSSMMRSPHTNPFWWIFPMNPLSMTLMSFHSVLMVSHNLLLSSFWGSYILVMMTTMMPFYVLMMGAEMLFLVYERYKRSRPSCVKRWALAIIVAMPIFVWLIPYYTNFYIFGMSGMLVPVTLLGFSLSMIAISVASIIFGRRAFCNTMCMSAHMWTNVYYDQFKAKKSSKFWEYFRWVPLAVMIGFFSYWVAGEMGIVQFLKLGSSILNPLDLFGMFTLNYVWWFFFFMTPVFGTYSCARQGWCGYGTFTGLFNKVIFKVKSKDVEVCRSCNSVSCESSCPSKIDIRKDVLSKGFSNRISCVGCGDCIEACPFNNLYIQDIRNVFRKQPNNGVRGTT
ncbi:hypothetical protein IC006_2561 [Sulfuracidifex tepidarius]|uniref:4Fe-4S ferredoxin-type domain-containing protein n=1 Tax=Sulfuracidifex tepidarius TaxID=1294262 RepID=A0A510DYB7_9CREN|nr:4Fe-4S ferredoxin [Sulfuracidifex tepidarius]BBG25226.1 hypothetical protein IC006_2561 [Sulfuracidifex tepidarius]